MLMKILVAEDEPAIRQGIIALIGNLGLSVEITGAAEDGMEALELMAATRPDVLITDIRMPGMSGLELIGKANLRKIRRNRTYNHCRACEKAKSCG